MSTHSFIYIFSFKNKDKVPFDAVGRGYSRFHYTDFGIFILIISLLVFGLYRAYSQLSPREFSQIIKGLSDTNLLYAVSMTLVVCFFLFAYFLRRKRPVYLVDFTVLEPPEHLKVLYRTGIGEETYFPPGIHAFPPEMTIEQARNEAEIAMFTVLDELFLKTGVKPSEIDIIITNCSLFCPTPSLSSMIVNRFKLKSSILSYSLGGMGCSAGVIAIDLAKHLLQSNKNCNAIVVSTENITQNFYTGNERSMLVSNTLFRLGAAAILLSNKSCFKYTAPFELLHSVRVHKGSVDSSYRAIFQETDSNGHIGVRLSKDLIKEVGSAMHENFTTLGPLVLPITEQIKFFWSYVQRKFLGTKTKQYIPDFRKAFQHYCIHAGGRAIIDGVQRNFNLSSKDVEASRWALWRYGNTSSASIWYEFHFLRKYRTLVAGEKILQLALGSGLKTNTAVWKVRRPGAQKAPESPPNVNYLNK